jgi:hypothetical protein
MDSAPGAASHKPFTTSAIHRRHAASFAFADAIAIAITTAASLASSSGLSFPPVGAPREVEADRCLARREQSCAQVPHPRCQDPYGDSRHPRLD